MTTSHVYRAPPPAPSQAAIDAWMVDYNAALATICFMLFLGELVTTTQPTEATGICMHTLIW